MNVLSLFAGIGGLDLGLERAGMTVVGQVEIDPFCRRVLERHWPDVPRHDDVRTAVAWWVRRGAAAVDMVCGGFPCQPFSTAGLRRGVTDERWGWPWMADVVRAVRPKFVVVENVPALLADRDAFGWLLADLARLGFDAEWSVLSACALGAPHTRERLFLVANANGGHGQAGLGPQLENSAVPHGYLRESAWHDPVDGIMEADGHGRRVADGLSAGLEPARVRALGNAVVPQVAEHIGRMVMEAAA